MCQVARAGAGVQDEISWADVEGADHGPFPTVVQAEAQHRIRQVVAAGDRFEHHGENDP
jgi:hypothetical protein